MTASPAVGEVPGGPVVAARSPSVDIVREITRGGLAGLVVGLVLAGIGGRLAMRAAALLEPDAAGLRTENGNVIGAITPEGTLALVVFAGLLFGIVVGALWVVMRPWLPRSPGMRALTAVPIALAMGSTGLISATNPDFMILGRNLGIVLLLVVLVALFGPAIVLAETLLDRVLPVPGSRRSVAPAVYAVITTIGTLFTLLLVLPLYLTSSIALAGAAFVVVGLATAAHWLLRSRRTPEPVWLPLVARGALVLATVAGLAVAVPEILGAANLA
ncbi:MAG TPA: hypothetical protein VFL03_09425 [Candidatus Limnocylindrales bacterium]|nr:hypothetical protein [Candidatus Limnocylindrales bacterium]